MSTSQALIPMQIEARENRKILEVSAIVAGSLVLAVLAQVAIPLPFSPVPITGQTLGVALMALAWGSKRALLTYLLYLGEGAIGLPVFAMGQSALTLGPTAGYLVGMGVACGVVGKLADRGFPRTFGRALLACYAGSICIFGFGLLGLSLFLPNEQLLTAGLLPFLPGDLIKNTLAASMACAIYRGTEGRSGRELR